MVKYGFALGLVCILGLSSCSRQEEGTQAAAPSAEPQHVFKDQVQALDKAKQVEKTIMDTHERRSEELGSQ